LAAFRFSAHAGSLRLALIRSTGEGFNAFGPRGNPGCRERRLAHTMRVRFVGAERYDRKLQHAIV